MRGIDIATSVPPAFNPRKPLSFGTGEQRSCPNGTEAYARVNRLQSGHGTARKALEQVTEPRRLRVR
jgi:hypothetical protein